MSQKDISCLQHGAGKKLVEMVEANTSALQGNKYFSFGLRKTRTGNSIAVYDTASNEHLGDILTLDGTFYPTKYCYGEHIAKLSEYFRSLEVEEQELNLLETLGNSLGAVSDDLAKPARSLEDWGKLNDQAKQQLMDTERGYTLEELRTAVHKLANIKKEPVKTTVSLNLSAEELAILFDCVSDVRATMQETLDLNYREIAAMNARPTVDQAISDTLNLEAKLIAAREELG